MTVWKRTPPPEELAVLLPGEKFQENPWNPTGAKHRWQSKQWTVTQWRDGVWSASVYFYAFTGGPTDAVATLKEAISVARKAWEKEKKCQLKEIGLDIAEVKRRLAKYERSAQKLREAKVP